MTQGRVIKGSENLNSCIIRVASYFISQKISWFLLFYHGLHRKVRDWGLDNRHLPYWMHALTRLLFLSYIVICCDIKLVKMVQTCSEYGCLKIKPRRIVVSLFTDSPPFKETLWEKNGCHEKEGIWARTVFNSLFWWLLARGFMRNQMTTQKI